MDVFKKAFLAGLGAVSLTKDKAQKIADELIAEGQMKEKEGRKLMQEMMVKAEAVRKEVEKTINTQVSSAYAKINLATQEQLKRMEKRIHDLEKAQSKNPKPKSRSAKKKNSR